MKAKHSARLLAVLLSVAMLLAMLTGCAKKSGTASSGETAKADEVTDWVFSMPLSSEMETFNILYSQQSVELTILSNCIDGLLTNDTHGKLPTCHTCCATPTAANITATHCKRRRRSPSNSIPSSTFTSGLM